MADIELVIKIDEDAYKATCSGFMLTSDVENVVRGLINGTLLPKGHGRLKDVDHYTKMQWEHPDYSLMDDEPTIIEADEAESEGGMTREEQIDWLCRLRADLNNGVIFTPWNKEFTEALNDVLEQEANKVDCISRDTVKNYIQAHIHEIITESGEDKNKHTNRVLRSMIHGVDCMPSTTPQEPKKGKWIKTPKAVMGEGYMWYCDKCNYEVYQDSSRNYPSEKCCPNCGDAKIEPGKVRDKE